MDAMDVKDGRKRTRRLGRVARDSRPLAATMLAAAMTVAFAMAGCSGGGDETVSSSDAAVSEHSENRVLIKTSKGTIEVELYPDKAPKTVDNFLAYIDAGFYDGTIFHRVIEDFMVQGGGYDSEKQRKSTRDPVDNEASNGIKNEVGALAMARTSAPHSATSQFFINVKENKFLDFKSETPSGWGYTVFGKVVDGMDVVRVIEQSPTKDQGGAFRDIPEEAIVIESISRK